MDPRTKIAIIGAGRWGKNLIKEFDGQAHISYCLHNGNEETENWLKQNYPDIQTANAYQTILEDKEVEAIIIATPINTHYKIALEALRANKNIFIEKPGTETSKEMRELCVEAKERGLTIALGYVFLHHPIFTKIQELIKNQKIESIHFEWLKWGTFTEHPVLNLLSHEISIAIALGMTPETKSSYSENTLLKEADILETSFVTKGSKITTYLNRTSNDKKKTVTIKTDQNIYIWENNSLFTLDKNTQEKREVKIEDKRTPLNLEVADFLKNINGETEPKADGLLAVEVLKTIELL